MLIIWKPYFFTCSFYSNTQGQEHYMDLSCPIIKLCYNDILVYLILLNLSLVTRSLNLNRDFSHISGICICKKNPVKGNQSQTLNVLKNFWENSGLFFSGVVWSVLVRSLYRLLSVNLGTFWNLLGQFETFWDSFDVLGHFGMFWDVMQRFGTILGCFETFKDVFVCFCMFWDISGHFVPLWKFLGIIGV